MARQRVSTAFWLLLADLGIMRARVEERLKRNRLRSSLRKHEGADPPAAPHSGTFDGGDSSRSAAPERERATSN